MDIGQFQENVFFYILTSLISGLIGVLLTLFLNHKVNQKKNKKHIFETLLSYRHCMTREDNILKINIIQVIFRKNKKVIESWYDFVSSTSSSDDIMLIKDKYLKLMEEMAMVLGYKELNWNKIKVYYFPSGLAHEIGSENEIASVHNTNDVKYVPVFG